MHQVTDDRVEPFEHIGISQTHDPYAQRREIIVALVVVDAAPVMHRTVDLDGEPEFRAIEVDDVSPR